MAGCPQPPPTASDPAWHPGLGARRPAAGLGSLSPGSFCVPTFHSVQAIAESTHGGGSAAREPRAPLGRRSPPSAFPRIVFTCKCLLPEAGTREPFGASGEGRFSLGPREKARGAAPFPPLAWTDRGVPGWARGEEPTTAAAGDRGARSCESACLAEDVQLAAAPIQGTSTREIRDRTINWTLGFSVTEKVLIFICLVFQFSP